MTYQVQTKRYHTGQFGNDGWELYWEGHKIPKYIRKDMREMERDDRMVRVVKKGEDGYIEEKR